MRLAVCTLSAVLLSGCSWLGYGGSNTGVNLGAVGYGNGCGNVATTYGGQYGYQQTGYDNGCSPTNGNTAYGYGASGYGSYGAQMQQASQMQVPQMQAPQIHQGQYGVQDLRGTYQQKVAYGQNAYGQVAYGANSGTVLGGAAPYGTAISGQSVGQAVGQVAGMYGGVSGNVQTVLGSPVYVPQPYPAYYGVSGGACCGELRGGYSGGAAMPFGIEAGIGTDLAIGGNIIGAKPGGPALGGAVGSTLNTSGSPEISYGDAYKNALTYDIAATYDINPSTTLIGRLGYSKADGQRVRTGTIDDSLFVPAPATVTTEDVYAQWSDLEQFTLEGGARKYMGGWNNAASGIRPYVQATAGFAHNNAISLSQDSATLMPAGTNIQPYADAGWTPTASGAVGAEMQVGPRTAIGVEAGIRWQDDLNTIATSDDRWSVPIKLRGRVSF